METLCKIRDLYMAIGEFELEFEKKYELSLNDGMLLCTLLKTKNLTSTELARQLMLTCSNTSKVIKKMEEKKYIKRKLGKEDKRQMYFSLTAEGEEKITSIKDANVSLPKKLAELLG